MLRNGRLFALNLPGSGESAPSLIGYLHPIEGVSADDYIHPSDPINSIDLDGRSNGAVSVAGAVVAGLALIVA